MSCIFSCETNLYSVVLHGLEEKGVSMSNDLNDVERTCLLRAKKLFDQQFAVNPLGTRFLLDFDSQIIRVLTGRDIDYRIDPSRYIALVWSFMRLLEAEDLVVSWGISSKSTVVIVVTRPPL